ncbi:MAG: phenylacetate--CoA ligase [Cyclobacteriaceae bacterium]|nr:phenylacetate--CoA ligase [Cyclobacteriaceae bacterium]
MESLEKQSPEKIAAYQHRALTEQLKYVAEKSGYYQAVFREHHINVEDIQSIEDLASLPFTTKDDLQKHQHEFYCVGKDKIIDYAATSGTQGQPVTIPQTDKDLERLAYNEARSLRIAGGSGEDIFQLTTTINKQFMAGLAYFLGIRLMGAGVVRVGSGAIPLQWHTILNMKPTALIVVPSFLVKMIEYAEKNGIDLKNISVKRAVCIGEPIRRPDFELNSLGRRIKQSLDIDLYSTYASSEMATAFTECEAGRGGHHQPDLIIAEIIDEQGRQVADGTPGELVITTLGLEAMPLVRFRTGDICARHSDKCSCGRNTFRLGPVIGRKNQMIKYKGTTLYPPIIFDVLNAFSWIKAYQIQLRTDALGNDEIVVKINEITVVELDMLKEEFGSKLRVRPVIEMMAMDELHKIIFKEGIRKPVNFSDLRHLN